jgi:hypothetical protein
MENVMSDRLVVLVVALASMTSAALADAPGTTRPSPDERFAVAALLYSDDFSGDSGRWAGELENGGSVSLGNGRLDIDVPAGASIWFKPKLTGPVMIQYEAVVIKAGGPNDRVSDLNCFWMAHDPLHPDDLLAAHRSGKFADYNSLLTYYVGLGGNGNTTTRFRRYIGDPVQRLLRPQDDLRDPANMIIPNKSQLIQIIAAGSTIEFFRDGDRLFEYADPNPYTSGWFALRTTKNHMQARHFRVFALTAAQGAATRGDGD